MLVSYVIVAPKADAGMGGTATALTRWSLIQTIPHASSLRFGPSVVGGMCKPRSTTGIA